jgi:hypothetical protein
MDEGIMEAVIILVLVLVLIAFGLGLYFLPTLIAMARHNVNTLAIFLLNFFTGWTFVGWIASLIWAVIV